MSESTLAMTYDQIRQRIGHHRGYGRVIADWADNGEAEEDIEQCLKIGASMFYFPAVQPPHEWSFLRPVKTLTINDGDTEIELPDDFGYLCGEIYFVEDDGVWGEPLKVMNEGRVLLAQQQAADSSGIPIIAAITNSDSPGRIRGQRWSLLFYPEADQEYTIKFQYSCIPNALSESNPYHYGGAAHSETFVEACLAASEQSLDGMMGIHGALFQQRMKASIDYDRRMKPETIGRGRSMYEGNFTVTYNGLTSP